MGAKNRDYRHLGCFAGAFKVKSKLTEQALDTGNDKLGTVSELVHSAERNWLTEALSAAAATRLQAGDVGCALFPQSGEIPGEDVLAAVRLLLFRLVAGIEQQILAAEPVQILPLSWGALSTSGLLRDDGLIAFCLARCAERRLRDHVSAAALDVASQIPARTLHDSNPLLSTAARKILAGENLALLDQPAALTEQLPADLFHALAWKVVAALQYQDALHAQRADVSTACKRLLARRDESDGLQSVAAKLVYFLPESMAPSLRNLREAGLSLFVAGLSHELGLSQDTLYRLLDHDRPAPTLLVLRAAGLSSASALDAMNILRGHRDDAPEKAVSQSDLDGVSRDDALAALRDWQFSGSIQPGPNQ